MDQVNIDGKLYIRQAQEGNCFGCAAFGGKKHNADLCDALPDCDGIIWVEVPETRTTPNTPYDICMKEHYKYLQYDLADMDDFERGCIVGRKLQSEKLARMIKNG